MPRQQLARIYLALSVLQLVPIWAVRYLPTVDGASHVYNAWILRELLTHRGALVQHYFQIDWQPHPNWIATAAMALLMTIVPPIIVPMIAKYSSPAGTISIVEVSEKYSLLIRPVANM